MQTHQLQNMANVEQGNCFYNIQPASTPQTPPPLHHFTDLPKASYLMAESFSGHASSPLSSARYDGDQMISRSLAPMTPPPYQSESMCLSQTANHMSKQAFQIKDSGMPSSPDPISIFSNTMSQNKSIKSLLSQNLQKPTDGFEMPISASSIDIPHITNLSSEMYPHDKPTGEIRSDNSGLYQQEPNLNQTKNTGNVSSFMSSNNLGTHNIESPSMTSSLHSTLDLTDLDLTSMDSITHPKCGNARNAIFHPILDSPGPVRKNSPTMPDLYSHYKHCYPSNSVTKSSKQSSPTVTGPSHHPLSKNIEFNNKGRRNQFIPHDLMENSNIALRESEVLKEKKTLIDRLQFPVTSHYHPNSSRTPTVSLAPDLSNRTISADCRLNERGIEKALIDQQGQDILASAMACTFGGGGNNDQPAAHISGERSYNEQKLMNAKLPSSVLSNNHTSPKLMHGSAPNLQQCTMPGSAVHTNSDYISLPPKLCKSSQKRGEVTPTPISDVQFYQDSHFPDQHQPSYTPSPCSNQDEQSNDTYIGHVDTIELSSEPPSHSSFIPSAYAESHATSNYNPGDDSDDGYDYDGMEYYFDDPEEPIIIDIDLNQRPQSLQQAINMYIEFLIWENQKKLHIDFDELPNIACDFEEERYYSDTIKKPTPFPTKKLKNWLKLYNVDIEITDPEGNVIPQTTFQSEETLGSLQRENTRSNEDFHTTNGDNLTSNYVMNWQMQKDQNGNLIKQNILDSSVGSSRSFILSESSSDASFRTNYINQTKSLISPLPISHSDTDYGNGAIATLAATSAVGMPPNSTSAGPQITSEEIRAMIIEQQMNSKSLPLSAPSSMPNNTRGRGRGRRGRPPGRSGIARRGGRGRSYITCGGQHIQRRAPRRRGRGRPPSKSYSGNVFRNWNGDTNYCYPSTMYDEACSPPGGMLAHGEYTVPSNYFNEAHLPTATNKSLLPSSPTYMGQGSIPTLAMCSCAYHVPDHKDLSPTSVCTPVAPPTNSAMQSAFTQTGAPPKRVLSGGKATDVKRKRGRPPKNKTLNFPDQSSVPKQVTKIGKVGKNGIEQESSSTTDVMKNASVGDNITPANADKCDISMVAKHFSSEKEVQNEANSRENLKVRPKATIAGKTPKKKHVIDPPGATGERKITGNDFNSGDVRGTSDKMENIDVARQVEKTDPEIKRKRGRPPKTKSDEIPGKISKESKNNTAHQSGGINEVDNQKEKDNHEEANCVLSKPRDVSENIAVITDIVHDSGKDQDGAILAGIKEIAKVDSSQLTSKARSEIDETGAEGRRDIPTIAALKSKTNIQLVNNDITDNRQNESQRVKGKKGVVSSQTSENQPPKLMRDNGKELGKTQEKSKGDDIRCISSDNKDKCESAKHLKSDHSSIVNANKNSESSPERSSSDSTLSIKSRRLNPPRQSKVSCSDTQISIKEESKSAEKIRETRSTNKGKKKQETKLITIGKNQSKAEPVRRKIEMPPIDQDTSKKRCLRSSVPALN